jgi:hypothetical protein
MKVDGLPNLDFTSCDCCRATFSRARPPLVLGIEQDGKELILGLCAGCMTIMTSPDRSKGAAVSERAGATARLRRGRLRAAA